MTPTQVNLDLARALGVTNADGVTRITIDIMPGQYPEITVERQFRQADQFVTAIEMLSLRPVPADRALRDTTAIGDTIVSKA